jgi:signal peptidase I
MTSADSASKRSPWLSIWFKPGDTIEGLLATKPKRNLLLLATLGVAYMIVSTMVDEGLTTALVDWRFLVGTAFIAAIMGIASLYLSALFLSWSGRIFGGRASPAHMRAVLAWGMAPLCAALVIYLVTLTGLRFFASGNTNNSASAAVVIGLRAIGVVMAVWMIIAMLAMLKRAQAFGWWRATFNLVIGSLLPALLIAVPIRAFLFQPFNIPAGSMVPTLLIGDYIFVSKYAYGYTRFSLPFSPPLFAGRILPAEPQRGDVVVFRLPKDTATDYVKRIVGLPGDRIQMKDGVLIINGVPVKRERVEDFIDEENGQAIRRWRETLPNGVSYFAIDIQDNGFLDNTQVYAVPSGYYFMLGDNLDNSTDSRVLNAVGYVPFENLIGRIEIIYFSIDRVSNKEQPRIRYERIGMAVR